jgi:hypothetical protein
MFVTSFNKVMSRDRFDLIWRYLHLQDNEAVDEERPDKLIKIRWYLDYLDQKCSYNFIPKTNATFDESMIKFKGRLSFRQYLPANPTKWGGKLWNMADSDTGYMHCFQIYTGKEDAQEKGSSYRVVMDLCSNILGKTFEFILTTFIQAWNC